MKKFQYRSSCRIIHWNCIFDSLTELRYAISIQCDYEYLHAHIPVYYDPKTMLPVNYIRNNIRRYTPDFLIRHKITNEAFWTEIKPRAFELDEQLVLRRQVAENYIRWKNYDWKFKVVFDDEIKLSAAQQKIFSDYQQSIGKSYQKLKFHGHPQLFPEVAEAKVQFVIFGTRRNEMKRLN